MRLIAEDRSQSFELRLRGYQNVSDEYYVLTVEGRVSHPRGDWSFSEACLMPSEASELAVWLESLAGGTAAERKLSFTEPNLHFAVAGDHPQSVRVYLELEARPSWAPSDVGDTDDLWVEFSISELDILACAASIYSQLRSLPVYRP